MSELEEEEEVYEVENIRKWRYNLKRARTEYFIKWRNYPEDQNTWEPSEHLNCPKALKRFKKKLRVSERQFLDAKHPNKLTGLQRNAEIISMCGRFEFDQHQPSTSRSSNRKGGNVIVYIIFEDDEDTLERVDMDELREFRPDKAFEFAEQRLIDKAVLFN